MSTVLSKLNFFTILLIAFVDYLGVGLVYPVFSTLLFDASDPLNIEGLSLAMRGALLGLLIALTPITQFFSSPILGKLSDTKGRKSVLIYGTFLGCVGYCFAILGIQLKSIPFLFLYRILIGISAGTIAVAQAMIVDISNEQNKSRRFALFNASLGTGFTIGPFLGGKLADPSFSFWASYSLPFAFAGLLSLINLFLIFWRFPETLKIQKKEKLQFFENIFKIRKVFFWVNLRWLFLATFAFSFGWSFFNEFIPLLLRQKFGFSAGEIGNYYAYGGGWYAISAGVLTAPLLKRFSPERIVIKSLIGSAICMLLYLAIPNANGIWLILPFLMYCLAATYPTTSALISNQAGNENQGEVLGVYQSVNSSAMGISPLVVGSLIGIYPEITCWGGALAMLLASSCLVCQIFRQRLQLESRN